MLSLIRVRAYHPDELAPELFNAVGATEATLQKRYYPGAIRRLGQDAASAHAYVSKLIQRDALSEIDEENGHETFAVVPDNERFDGVEVVGLATLIKGINVRQHRLPLPPTITNRLPDSWSGKNVNLARVNVTGWTLPEYDEDLHEVYGTLLSEIPGYSAWTMEPRRSDPIFHDAIQRAGMAATGAEVRYDVGEVSDVTPPVAQAYVRSPAW